MKRKLDNKYEDLVNYVTSYQGSLYLSTIIDDFREDTQSIEIVNDLNIDNSLYLEKLDELIPIIVDIYNDNYELEEPECYWKFNELDGNFGNPLYAFKYRNKDAIGLSDNSKTKMTKTQFIELLSNSDTNLTIDNFIQTTEVTE